MPPDRVATEQETGVDILAERITESADRLTADPASGETTPSVTAVLLNSRRSGMSPSISESPCLAG